MSTPDDLFGSASGAGRRNPFDEDEPTLSPAEAAERLERAARKVRGLRMQLGSEGLTLPATRDLIDEVAGALESAARAFRGIGSGAE